MSLLPHEAAERVRQVIEFLRRGVDNANLAKHDPEKGYPFAYGSLTATIRMAIIDLERAAIYLPEPEEEHA